MKNKYLTLVSILSILVSILLGFLYLTHRKEMKELDNEFKVNVDMYNRKVDSLENDNHLLKLMIDGYKKQDSIITQKEEKVIIRYQTKYEQIKYLSDSSLINEFRIVFSENNIR